VVAAGLDTWLAVFARVAPVVALHPVFGGRATPTVVKASVAAALATALWANGSAANQVRVGMTSILSEAAIGLAVAVVGIAVFGAIEAAGRMVDDSRGANSARLFAPQLESATSPLGALDATASLALFWAVGHHAILLGALSASFESVPFGSWPAGPLSDREALLALTLEMVGSLARAGLAMAGPAAAATVTVDGVLGLIGRTSPQANVFSMSMPLKLAAALAVSALSMQGRAVQWGEVWALHDSWIRSMVGG
jgi:flagellar biosynthetic protein FliR